MSSDEESDYGEDSFIVSDGEDDESGFEESEEEVLAISLFHF